MTEIVQRSKRVKYLMDISTNSKLGMITERIKKIIETLPQNRELSPEKTKQIISADGIDCPICHNRCYVFVKEEGHTVAKPCICQKKRRQAFILRRSGISQHDYERYTLKSFYVDTPERTNMKQAAVCFIKKYYEGAGIGYFGHSGTGKTHICIAICQAIQREHYYFQYRREIQLIKNCMYRNDEKYRSMMDQWENCPILYMDDLFKGAWINGKIQQQDVQVIFEIVNSRYMKKLSTIVSSEQSLSEILSADEAIGSRLYEMLSPYIIEISGANYRIEE